MAQWLNKIKTLAGDAADSTSRAAQRAKLEADIKFLEREIRLCKERFGAAIFDIFTTDKEKVEAEYAAHLQEVRGLLSDVQTKQAAIEQLKERAVETQPSPSASADQSATTKGVITPPPSAVVPPPPPQSGLRTSSHRTEFLDSSTGKPAIGHREVAVGSPVLVAPASTTAANPIDSSSSAGSGMIASVAAAASTLAMAHTLVSMARSSEQAVVPTSAPGARDACSQPVTGNSNADPGAMASVFTAVAGLASATGTTNDVAKAAAPHVAAAAQQRYSGEQGMQNLSGDASTIASVGAAVANNPAARALGSALLQGAINSAAAPTSKR